MADREKILRYFRAGGDEELAAKLLDLAEGLIEAENSASAIFLIRMAVMWPRSLRPILKM